MNSHHNTTHNQTHIRQSGQRHDGVPDTNSPLPSSGPAAREHAWKPHQ